MKRIAIVSTHPIQYNAPLFKALAKSIKIQIKVFYTWSQVENGEKHDPGFGKDIKWDIPLLDGYAFEFVKNVAKKPGSHHYRGINNPDLIKRIKLFQPHAVLIMGWSFISHFRCMRYFKNKIPVWFRGDSTLIDEQPGIKQMLRRIFLRKVYSYIDKAFYVGTKNKEYFEVHGLKESQLVYAPHAIDNQRFAEPDLYYKEQARILRNKLGIDEEAFVVLFVGKLEVKKNPYFLLELAKYLTGQQFRFVFVGNGILEQYLKQEAAMDKRILFLGFQNQQAMPIVYRIAGVFVLPSQGPGETWGLAMNEAMACGVPVVASNKCGGTVDLIIPNKNGLIFSAGEVGKVAAFIKKMLSKKVHKAYSQYSQEHIKNYSIENIFQSIENTTI